MDGELALLQGGNCKSILPPFPGCGSATHDFEQTFRHLVKRHPKRADSHYSAILSNIMKLIPFASEVSANPSLCLTVYPIQHWA
ncbi:hypothetical protein SHAM105786_08455 [Shewanella amazonensis]